MQILRRHLDTGVEVLINFVAPFVIFVALESEIGDLRALLVATVPPLVRAIVEFARNRRIDAVAMLVLAGILLSLLAFFGGGGIAMVQLRENLVGGLIGLVFLGSIAIAVLSSITLRARPYDARIRRLQSGSLHRAAIPR